MLAHEEWGSGPPLVLLHGLGAGRTRWHDLVPHLEARHRCLLVDLPGHGESPLAGSDVGGAALAVQELLGALEVRDPVLVGHSLGATVALLHAALFRPRGVVALDPAPMHLPALAATVRPFEEALRGPRFAAAFAEWEQSFAAVPPGGAGRLAELRPRQEVVLSYWDALLRDPEEAQRLRDSVLLGLAVPALVWLARPPSREDATLLARLATAELLVRPDLGHAPHLVDPGAVVSALEEWLGRLPTTPPP